MSDGCLYLPIWGYEVYLLLQWGLPHCLRWWRCFRRCRHYGLPHFFSLPSLCCCGLCPHSTTNTRG